MLSSVRLACIDPDTVGCYWPFARNFIKRAIDRAGLSDFDVIEADVLTGKQLLWLAWSASKIEGAGTTQIVGAGGRKICVIVAWGGGDKRRFLPLLARIEAYAKAEGCSVIRIYGRKGWERVLDGFSSKCVVLDKDL